MTTPRVVVVGLGPGDPSLVTAGVLAAIAATPVRFLRTERHPSASLVGGATTFDHHYEAEDTFEEVYRRITADLVAAATEHGDVLYAVPGSPRVLERTVDFLDAEAAAGTIELQVLAGLSFTDLAWVRLGVDPYEQGVRLVDGHRFAIAAAGQRGPLLVAHCHNRRVLSDVKLAVDDPPTEPVVVLQRLGLPDESVTTVEWADLDRSFEPDHLTSVYVPSLASPVAGEVAAFVELVATLRAECPWDAEQTHASLARHLLEETYEVLEALDEVGDGGPDVAPEAWAHLEEELGDLLFQIVFHTTLATEEGEFGLAEVARGVHDKLVHRHPHVFGLVEVDGADDVVANWEQIKKAEKGRASIFDGIPATLPALLHATKVTKKAAGLGLDPALDPGPLDAAMAAAQAEATDATIGTLLLAAVNLARSADVDPEAALRTAATHLRDRAQLLEG
ncbi:MazG family protein [Aquihabitans sp. G128]|uniref:MazG family protein n=1 Tax=Aquihabitans sp. G128 TaxID=2849779 RepID=UPI001C244747|nr:MazG family protein [Aquihabitans sp. G128]QXC61016.1 MazG family protein [Aquihabitans sp. G128]